MTLDATEDHNMKALESNGQQGIASCCSLAQSKAQHRCVCRCLCLVWIPQYIWHLEELALKAGACCLHRVCMNWQHSLFNQHTAWCKTLTALLACRRNWILGKTADLLCQTVLVFQGQVAHDSCWLLCIGVKSYKFLGSHYSHSQSSAVSAIVKKSHWCTRATAF